MSTYRSIIDQIYTIIQELEGSGQPFNATYKRLTANTQTFPVAMVDVYDPSERIRFDSVSDYNTYSFIIRCVFLDDNTQTANDLRLDTMDDVVDKLADSTITDTLRGQACKLDWNGPAPWFDQDTYGQPVLGFDIILSVGIIKNLTF